MLATVFVSTVIINTIIITTLWPSGEREEEGKGDVHGDQPLVCQARFDETATD